MKITLISSVIVSLALASEISAGLLSIRQTSSSNAHNLLARRLTRQKRCVRRLQSQGILGGADPSSSSSSSSSSSPSSSSSSSAPAQTPAQDQSGGGGGSAPGTIDVAGMNPPCGDPNASPTPTVDNGPNGQAEWLACGVRTNGWQPPPIFRQNVKYIDLESATGPGQVFSNCAPYLSLFNQFGSSTGIPPILLAAIASQESDCNPSARGPNGEYGLMQITGDKCPVQYDDSCLEPETNIGTGANYFAQTVDQSSGGNLAEAMGMYNGWEVGVTTVDTAVDGRTCGQRNNLDYLHMVFNGFMQGRDPRADPRMGTFFDTDC